MRFPVLCLHVCVSSVIGFSPVTRTSFHASSPSAYSHTTVTPSSTTLLRLFDNLFSTPTRTTVSTATKARVPPRKKAAPKVLPPENFRAPEPKPLAVTRSETLPDLVTSSLALALRLATGAFVLGWKIDTLLAPEDGRYALSLGPLRIRDSSSVLADAAHQSPPKDPCLVLYEYDASPYCKRVRETINLLDLTVEYRPCPGARTGFSDELFELTGRRTVPFLLDTRTGTQMFESSDIIQYLLDEYGPPRETYDAKALWPITWQAFSVTTSSLAALLRGMPASQLEPNARPDNRDMRPLELWGYECSPFVRPVREKLCKLGLAHVMVSCSRGSANRNKLLARSNAPTAFQVPFLVDPNTGIELFESNEIVEYLDQVYTI